MAAIGARIVTLVIVFLATVTFAEKVEFEYNLAPSGTICFLENIGEQVNGKSTHSSLLSSSLRSQSRLLTSES